MIRMHKMSTTHVACFLLLVIMTISGFVEAFFFSSTKTGYQQQDTVNILFGSCNSLNRDVPPTSLWNDMKTFNSSLLILGGDNIYTDHFNTQPAVLLRSLYKRTLPFVSASLEDIKREYSKLKKVESFQQLLGTGIELMAIYDDHDYGMNDGDRHFALREESKKLLLSELLNAPLDDVRYTQKGGAYHTKLFNNGQFRVTLLDVRYNKDSWGEKNNPTILGEVQWEWLENVFCKQQMAEVNIIVSPLQVIFQNRFFGENWNLFPKERIKFFELLRKCKVRVPFLLSGDIHMAEIDECKANGKYTIAEVTSSGITHSAGTQSPQRKRWFLDGIIGDIAHMAQHLCDWRFKSQRVEQGTRNFHLGLNFLNLVLDFRAKTIQASVYGEKLKVAMKQTWSFEELDQLRTAEEAVIKCSPMSGEISVWVNNFWGLVFVSAILLYLYLYVILFRVIKFIMM